MGKNNINYIDLHGKIEGKERRIDILSKPLDNAGFFPKTVTYKDIDLSFKEWVENEIKISSDEGELFPTMTLFSNQRFSEYAQSWSYTDSNNNLLLNFKTVNRDKNPRYGSIQSNYYNIPGDIFFTINKKKVVTENGDEAMMILKMRQPLSVDIIYKFSIFTNKFEKINEVNTLLNRFFSSRQTYIEPNGYYMPMILEDISDDSVYSIDDRQFYSQTFTIKVLAFLINEDDYRVEEAPVRYFVNVFDKKDKIKKPEAEIEECEITESPFYYKPIILTLTYPVCRNNNCKFKIDIDFVCEEIILEKNIKPKNFKILINGEEIENITPFKFKENDEIEVIVNKIKIDDISTMILNGYNPSVVYDENLNFPEIEKDNIQNIGLYDIKS